MFGGQAAPAGRGGRAPGRCVHRCRIDGTRQFLRARHGPLSLVHGRIADGRPGSATVSGTVSYAADGHGRARSRWSWPASGWFSLVSGRDAERELAAWCGGHARKVCGRTGGGVAGGEGVADEVACVLARPGQAVGVGVEQDTGAVAGLGGDLGGLDPGGQPQGQGGAAQVVGAASDRGGGEFRAEVGGGGEIGAAWEIGVVSALDRGTTFRPASTAFIVAVISGSAAEDVDGLRRGSAGERRRCRRSCRRSRQARPRGRRGAGR